MIVQILTADNEPRVPMPGSYSSRKHERDIMEVVFDSRFLLEVSDSRADMEVYQMKLHKCCSAVMKHWFGLQRESLVLDSIAGFILNFFLQISLSICSFFYFYF